MNTKVWFAVFLLLTMVIVGAMFYGSRVEGFTSKPTLTPREQELFEDLSNNRLEEDEIMKLVNSGVINDNLITKFLHQLDPTPTPAPVPAPSSQVVPPPAPMPTPPSDQDMEDGTDIVEETEETEKKTEAPKPAASTSSNSSNEQVAKVMVEPFCGMWRGNYASRL
jgi:hypothetical protein